MKHCKKLAAIASALLVLGFTACSSDGDGGSGSGSDDSIQTGIPATGKPAANKDKTSNYIGTKAPSEAKEVGDIVFSDGSAMPYSANITLTDNQKKEAVAVIFYVNQKYESPFRGKALGVGFKIGKNLQWAIPTAEGYSKTIESIACGSISSSEEIIKDFNKNADGSGNWKKLCDAVNDEDIAGNYPAWEYANSYGNSLKGEFSSGWYLPSAYAISYISICKNVFQKVLGYSVGDDKYWTSNDHVEEANKASDFNGTDEKDMKKSVFVIRTFNSLMPTSTGYIGTKNPSAKKSVGDIVFTDGSATPYKQQLDYWGYLDEIVAVIFYSGTNTNDVLGARTLGVMLMPYTTDIFYDGDCKWAANQTGNATNFSEIECVFSDPKPADKTPYYYFTTSFSDLPVQGFYFTGDFDGSDNWEKICEQDKTGAADAATNYPAFNMVNELVSKKGLTDNMAKGWYVPSLVELLVMTSSLPSYFTERYPNCLIWTSSQSNMSPFLSYYVRAGDSRFYISPKSDKKTVCAIRDFSTGSITPTTPVTKSPYIGSKSPKKTKYVGDIVFTDGSASPYTENITEEQKNKAIAVIFYAGQADDKLGAETLGVSVNSEIALWANSASEGYGKLIQGLVDPIDYSNSNPSKWVQPADFDGSDNWKILCDAVGDENNPLNYHAWYVATQYGKMKNLNGEFESGWYIPSIGELKVMDENLVKVNTALCKIGKINLSMDLFDTGYWTSNLPNDFSTSDPKALCWSFKQHKPLSLNTNTKNTFCVVRTFK